MSRLLVMTRIWPTPSHPSAGIFVKNRVAGVAGVTVVVARPARHWVTGLARLTWDGLRADRGSDGVEAHVLYPAGFAALIVARLRGVPLVVYSHGTDAREYPRFGRGYRFFVRRVMRGADLIVTNSTDTAERLRRIALQANVANADIRVIPPGYDDTLFSPTPRRATARGQVLYLGGANPRKGYEIARQVAHTLAGPGLQELPPAAVARSIAEHDVVLMPSQAESFGLVAAEAIGSGRWVVASDVGGLRDIVQNGVNGTLVADGDYTSALAAVPDYDPRTVARTVERFRLVHWQNAMEAAWHEVLARRAR